MKIYVAGPSADISPCRATIKLLQDAGHEITEDWTRFFGPNAEREESCPIEISMRDERGILNADVVVLVYTGVHSSGATSELGFARALMTPIIIRNLSHEPLLPNQKVFMHGIIDEFGTKHWFPVANTDWDLLWELEKIGADLEDTGEPAVFR